MCIKDKCIEGVNIYGLPLKLTNIYISLLSVDLHVCVAIKVQNHTNESSYKDLQNQAQYYEMKFL